MTIKKRKRRAPIGKLSPEEKELVYAWRAMDRYNRMHMIESAHLLSGHAVINPKHAARYLKGWE